MSKKKRVRRDIEKFYRTGRYWDLLRLLENEGLVSENPVEHRGAWKALIKQALQKEQAFEQFSREVGTLRVLPNDPDFRFLMSLKGFIEGRGTPDEVMELKGLSPDAERLRSNLAAFGSSSANEEKLRALLEKFMGEPEKITRRYFEQLAGYLPEQSLRETVRRFGETIPTARRFNGKAAVARGWDGIDMGRLQSLDRRLQFYSQRMPGALVEILLHPFIHNVAVMCRRLAPEAVGNGASQLIRAIPFLLPRLAGERHAEIQSKLLVHGAQWLEQGYGDLKALGQRLEGLSIEEKVSVLRGLRLGMQQRAPKGPDFDFPDYFEDVFSEEYDDDYEDEDDEDTDDEFEDWGGLKANAMARSLLLVHQSVLSDISTRFPELSHRDRKELVRVMEPILFQDMDHILNIVNSPDELVNLLDSTIRAGCGGTRTGLLSVVAGAHFRKVDLRKRAEELLDRSVPPTRDDMQWLATEWNDLIYPRPRSLKPLLVRYKNEKDLLAVFPSQLCAMMEFELLESALKSKLPGLPSILGDVLGMSKPEGPAILRRELDDLAEFDLFDLPRHFLRCYGDDRFNLQGHLCWFNALWTLRPTGIWDHVLGDMNRYGKMVETIDDLAPVTNIESLFAEKVEASVLFITEHLDELATVPMETLGSILERLLEQRTIKLSHQTLLIRLEKLLAERLDAGEEAARSLMQRIKGTLQNLARIDKKIQKTRKRRR